MPTRPAPATTERLSVSCRVIVMAGFAMFGVRSACADEPVPDEAQASEDTDHAEQLNELREMWRRRSELAGTVRYTLSGEAEHAAGSVVHPQEAEWGFDVPDLPVTGYPVDDTVYPVSMEWLIDFEAGTFRKTSRDMSFNMRSRAFRPFVRVEYFDGEGLKGYWPREENTSPQYTPHRDKHDVIYWTDEDLGMISNQVDLPIFVAHGLYGIRPGDLRALSLASIEDLELQGVSHLNGRDFLVVSVAPDAGGGARQVNYYVDPERDGAVARFETLSNGTTQIIDIAYAPHDAAWLPESWTWSQIVESMGTTTTYRMTVDEIELDPATSPDDFRVPLRPGMIVLRRDLEFQKEQVAADGTLKPYFPHGSTPAPPRSASNARGWLILLNVLLVVGGLLAYWHVARRRSTSAAPAN